MKTAADVVVRSGHATHVGHRREANEDALLCADPVFVVADGMGGYAGGADASRIIIETFAASRLPGLSFPEVTVEEVSGLLQAASQRITEETLAAGSTATGAVLVTCDGVPNWLVFNVGDSRTYLIRDGEFGQLTTDHSLVQMWVDAGHITREEARIHPRRNAITRSLGRGQGDSADFTLIHALPGDRIMVCSDGLSGEVAEEYLSVIAATGSPQEAADALVEAALAEGGSDNISVIVADLDPSA